MKNSLKIVLPLLLLSYTSSAQEGEVTSALSEISNKFKFTGFDYIAATLLAIGLVGVIWNVATNKPHAREYVISWFIGLIFCIFLSKYVF